MKNSNHKKLFSRSVEEARALEKISAHQKYLDALSDYEDRLYIDGEKYSPDSLKLLYLEALENVCSPVVIDMLASVDSDTIRDELVNEVFLDLAINQQKKTRFLPQLNKAVKLKTRGMVSTAVEVKRLNKYAVEDALAEMGITVRLNLVTKKIEVAGFGSDMLFELYSRANIASILPSIVLDHLKSNEIKGLGQGTKMIEQYLFSIADTNRYNPIHEMLEKYENDDEGNLDVLFSILGITDSFDKILVMKWFIQCVALAYNDDEARVSTEGILVLQGPQGCGKTSFFRRMALKSEWFTEGAVIDIRNKDSIISALSTWICELGEIDSTFKREQSALKAFITRPLDRIRFPYAAAESELPRNTSMCGTVNPDRFLNDTTGSRRYWVIPVSNIAKKTLFSIKDEDIMHIWGFFYKAYKNKPDAFRLTDEQRLQLEKRNRSHNCELKYEAEVLSLLDFEIPEKDWTEVSPTQLKPFVFGAESRQIGKVLTKVSQDDERVEKRKCSQSNIYLIPLKKEYKILI